MKIIAFLAARMGSTRVPFKNVRLLNGKPMFSYLLEESIRSQRIDRLFLNSDSVEILDIGKTIFEDKIEYHLRPSNLGNSSASLDDYVYDFNNKVESDVVIFLNRAVFLTAKSIDKAIDLFVSKNLSSMTACAELKTHAFINNQSINFQTNMRQPRSQDIDPVMAMTSGFFIWKTSEFQKSYEKNGFANFINPFETYPLNSIESIDIDNEDEWLLAEKFMSGKYSDNPVYHESVSEKIKNGEIKKN